MYAVLLQYIQHSAIVSSKSLSVKSQPTSISLANGNHAEPDDSFSVDGASTIGGTKPVIRRSPLEAGNVAILQASLDRLLPIVCLDATAGHEVWQTVAFTLLDALCLAAGEGTSGSKLASLLSKQGYLQAIVSSIKESEADLSEILKPDPGQGFNSLKHSR